MELKEMNTLHNLVENVLRNHPDTRNSDNTLYVAVLRILGSCKGINIEDMSTISFFLHMKEYGLPSIESVGRARRKVVEQHPELAGKESVKRARFHNEDIYKEYARRKC